MGVTVTTTYAGDIEAQLISQLATGNEAFELGLVNVMTNVTHKRVIPRIAVASLVQDRAATPTTGGDLTVDEAVLTPASAMVLPGI